MKKITTPSPQEPHTQFASVDRNGAYLPTLDGWRTIAISLVLFAHASDSIKNALQPNGLDFIFEHLKHIGLLGVQIFFGLSGFLITTKIIADERLRGHVSLKSFYVRRAFRILPASLVFLLAIAVLSMNGIIQVSIDRWVSTLLFFANYTTAQSSWYLGHFWSLAVEEHFYFLWPLAFIILATNSRRIFFAIWGIILLAFWRAIDFKFQLTGSSPGVFWGRTDIQADYILCGVLIALLYNEPTWKSRLQRFLATPSVWPLLVILVFSIATFQVPDWKLAFPLLTVKAIAIPLLILGTLTCSSKLPGRVLENVVFRWIGRLSYSLYLWQQLFLVWNESRTPSLSPLQSLPLNLLFAFACAVLSMTLIEKPLISIGHRIAKKIAPVPTASKAPPLPH